MSGDDRPFVRAPLATSAELQNEPAPFPIASQGATESFYDDWRRRLTRNLSSRSDGRWEPLTYIDRTSGDGRPS